MKIKIILPALLLITLTSISLLPVQAQSVTQTLSPAATPTYDPFAEPLLSEHPTQLELGQHVYWQHCMPCHGDVGQGLTDEFRLQWEPDHQNCWEAGCHSGRYANDSFPIPTIVPPLMGVELLAWYDPNSLFEYLKATHPPQDPGLLTDEEYQALVAFLYELNNESLPVEIATTTPIPPATPTASLIPAPNLPPSQAGNPNPNLVSFLIIPIALLLLASSIFIYIYIKRKRL
jgi:hypothetical protein